MGDFSMTNTTQEKLPRILTSEEITEFEVCEGGTLRIAGFEDPETRAQFYEHVPDQWEDSPADLANAMDDCQPLAWEVYSIYSDFRNGLQAEIDDAEGEEEPDNKKIAALNARLASMPEEPEKGAEDWLLEVDNDYFKTNIVERIKYWFSDPPSWQGWEDDYLPEMATGQGAALEFFLDLDQKSLNVLGVKVIEGLYPSSTCWAAELHSSITEANTAAEAAGLQVRFVMSKKQSEQEQHDEKMVNQKPRTKAQWAALDKAMADLQDKNEENSSNKNDKI
jgi:hypothetical protein